jgi:hypothetical protein
MTVPAADARARFVEVCTAVRENLAIAADLVLVHNETEVRGRQPRASLNRAIVVTSVGAWERFVADTEAAFTDNNWDIEAVDSSVSKSYAARAEAALTAAGACAVYRDAWSARAATDWRGITLRRMESLLGQQPGSTSGLTLSQHLDQWIELRNAVAHHQVRELAAVAIDAAKWRAREERRARRRLRQDPYATPTGRWVLWDSSAGSDEVQAGAARACLALVLQILDGVIIEICHYHSWTANELRLPMEWFASSLPASFRGVEQSRQHHATLWGGTFLNRRSN